MRHIQTDASAVTVTKHRVRCDWVRGSTLGIRRLCPCRCTVVKFESMMTSTMKLLDSHQRARALIDQPSAVGNRHRISVQATALLVVEMTSRFIISLKCLGGQPILHCQARSGVMYMQCDWFATAFHLRVLLSCFRCARSL